MTDTTTTYASYETIAPPVTTTSFDDDTPTSTSTNSLSTAPSVITTSATLSSSDLPPTSTATTETAPQPTTSASYAQILNGGVVAKISWSNFADSDFDALCPSHDCVQDCQNYTRLFEEVPYPFTDSSQTYGKSVSGQPPETTLFGICSNLANIFTGISLGTVPNSALSYFPLQSQVGVNLVASSLASCLTSTCDSSREPQNCLAACNIPDLYADNSTDLAAVTSCLSMICGNTCGLPYADQDVMGVGVLASYVIQGGLIICCAIILLVAAAYYAMRAGGKVPALSKNSRSGLEGFLAAQCYFTIALVIAALCSSPWDVDPLNGYALLSVAITGFLCPVFTLMLLHSRGCRSSYLSLLTTVSYVLATAVFWTLYRNLSRHLDSTTGSDEALRELYQIPTCGGSSAIALCPQTIGSDPLDYLAGFYNKDGIPNLRTMPLLWGWTTFVLVLLAIDQALHSIAGQKSKLEAGSKPMMDLLARIVAHPVALLVACTLFGLCLGYQAEMLRRYSGSDVIDWNGWSFGQVVAVVIWVQPIAEYIHMRLRDHMDEKKPSKQQPTTQNKTGCVAVSQGATFAGTPSIVNTPDPQRHSMHSPSGSSSFHPRSVSPNSILPTSRTY